MFNFSAATLRGKRDLCKPRGVNNVPYVKLSDVRFQHGNMFAYRFKQAVIRGRNNGVHTGEWTMDTNEIALVYWRYKQVVDGVRSRYPSLDTTNGGTK